LQNANKLLIAAALLTACVDCRAGNEPSAKEFMSPTDTRHETAEPSEYGSSDVEVDRRGNLRLRDDLADLPADLWSDFESLVSVRPAAVIGVGGGVAAISANNWDADIANDTDRHARRWGGLNNVFDVVGHPATHLGAVGAVYAGSLIGDDPEFHRFSKAALHALIITDVTVLGLKYGFDTDRPNGDRRGFPSGHTASSFALAAVIEEHHGLRAGIAGYAVAGLVAWHRIDDRKHDLSDVLFGAALGLAIGKCVGKNHHFKRTGVRMTPYADLADGSTGMVFERSF
jgi:hypothetical protein